MHFASLVFDYSHHAYLKFLVIAYNLQLGAWQEKRWVWETFNSGVLTNEPGSQLTDISLYLPWLEPAFASLFCNNISHEIVKSNLKKPN